MLREISLEAANRLLRRRHYLGPSGRGFALGDEEGVMVFANPSSRHLPSETWLELVRWCITGGKNSGSRQWRAAVRWLRVNRSTVTTIVSYSDPGAGHTGALYRSANWWWAPTWHRIRPPPTMNGSWDGETEMSVKDRWVYPIRSDQRRVHILRLNDDGLLRAHPELEYREPGGVPYKAWQPERVATAKASPVVDMQRSLGGFA